MKETRSKQELRALMQDGLYTETYRTTIAFILLMFIAFAACLFLPDLREKAIEQISALFAQKELTTAEGNISFLALFTNNAYACLFSMLWGLVPFAFLPALALGTNAMLLGVMAAHAVHQNRMLFLLVGVLPHGIFEIPAMILAFAMGFYVCGQMTRRCKKDKSAHSFVECLILISRLFFMTLVPILVIAAAIETWITPLLLQFIA